MYMVYRSIVIIYNNEFGESDPDCGFLTFLTAFKGIKRPANKLAKNFNHSL